MTIKEMENRLKEVKKIDKRLKLMNQLLKVTQEMHKLDGSYDLNEILMHEPKFTDELYIEITKVIENLEDKKKSYLPE